MSEQLQLRRGTATQVTAFTGAQGETVVDTTNNRLVVQDGATAGGWPAAKLSEVITNTRMQVNDAAYTVQTTDRLVAYIAISAARVVTLPAAAAFPTGVRLIVVDESGACSATNTITLTRAGSDIINGATTAVVASAYGCVAIESNGSNKWTIVDQISSGSSSTRTAVSDAAYTVLTTDRNIAYTALTAARTVSLPTAASFPVGLRLAILDESGAASGTLTITIAANGTDTIDGAANVVITSAYGYVAVESNGSNKWTIVDQAASSLAAVGIGTAVDPNNLLSVTAVSALFNSNTNFNVTVNKGGASGNASDTASFIFEDGFSGRAQIGLCGDDNFHFKVSPNGSTWYDALIINSGTGQATLASSASFSFASKFRNGTMDVWQRGAGPLTVTTSGAYTADGWIVVPTGASVTAQQVSGRGPTLYSLKVAGATSVTDALVKQRIESFIAAPLAGQIVTVQAQIYNNTGASITPLLTVKHAGAQDNWTSSTTDVSAVSLQSCANGAWTRVAYTFTASSSSSNGLEISFDCGNNFGSSSNSIQITELDIRVTPNVATGQNGNPPVPELRPIASELAFCQRHYYRRNSFSIGSSGSGDAIGMLTAVDSADVWGKMFDLPVELRIANGNVGLSDASDLMVFDAGGISSFNVNSLYGALTASTRSIASYTGMNTSATDLVVGNVAFLVFASATGWIDVSVEL